METFKLNHLDGFTDKDLTYGDFCKMLAKSGEVMDKEISRGEELLIQSVHDFEYNFQTNVLGHLDISSLDRAQSLCVEHMITGIVGEVGELLDVVKNLVIYRKDISGLTKEGKRFDNNFQEEIGDLMFYFTEFYRIIEENNCPNRSENSLTKREMLDYVECIINQFNTVYAGQIRPLTLEMCVEENVRKLSKRYHKLSYSDEQAKERADK